MLIIFEIPENIFLLLYQQKEQEMGRPRERKGFKTVLEEYTKGMIWRSCWWLD